MVSKFRYIRHFSSLEPYTDSLLGKLGYLIKDLNYLKELNI